MDNDKVVALCSGGFDSIVLLHDLRHNNPDLEIHTLFFDYGQRNKVAEQRCAEKASRKLKCTLHIVKIPPISWTNSNFYGEDFKDAPTQYLEYRNLIFFSYALSLAQSYGATGIYAAILKSHWGYADTSKEFISALNTLSELQGISIFTPYADVDKNALGPLAFEYGVYVGDWFSCDTPKVDEQGLLVPCGECPDCVTLKRFEYQLSKSPVREAFVNGKVDTTTQKFQESLREYPIRELRVLTNNSCQLKCPHCFYGFDKMKGDPLTYDEMYWVIKQAINDIGVKSLHYAGKEPLFNRDIWRYIERVRQEYPNIEQSIVTNGINVTRDLDLIVKNKVELFLSIDSSILKSTEEHIRDIVVTQDLLNVLRNKGVPVTVFIDLHEGTYDKVYELIDTLRKNCGVSNFHIRTLRPIGNAKKNNIMLSEDKVMYALVQAYTYCKCYPNEDFKVTVDVGLDYSTKLLQVDNEITRLSKENFVKGYLNIAKNFSISWELFCNKYVHTLTVSPDGYIFGCGMELANTDYDKISVGNAREYTLKTLLAIGKEKSVSINKDICKSDCITCKFNK